MYRNSRLIIKYVLNSLKKCDILLCRYKYFKAESTLFKVRFTAVSGGAVALSSWLVRSSPDRTVRVRALAGDNALCSWTRHLSLSASLHPSVSKTPKYSKSLHAS